eukprot:c4037_g1_i1.p1 GENE.c4037_g1_i1~~c4037_g1_i1.p1  ORF type:complete len:350 (-),score=107.23 c4037_g1_i1:33-1082(-)
MGTPESVAATSAPAAPTPTPKPDVPEELTVSIHSLKSLSLRDQIQVMLLNAHVLTFDRIFDLTSQSAAPSNASAPSSAATPTAAQVAEVVNEMGMLVQGVWVLNSAARCGDHANEALLRDWILIQLNECPMLCTHEINLVASLIGVAQPKAVAYLNEVCVKRQFGYAAFKLPPDIQFITRFPEIWKHQSVLWQKRMREVRDTFKSLEFPTDPPMGICGYRPFSVEAFLFRLMLHTPVTNYQTIRSRIIDWKKSTASSGISDEEIIESTKRICAVVKGRYIAAKLNNPVIDKYRNLALKLLDECEVVEMAKFKIASREAFGMNFPATVFQFVMNSLAVTDGNGNWTLKTV